MNDFDYFLENDANFQKVESNTQLLRQDLPRKKAIASKTQDSSPDYPVLAEIPITSTELHYIANGNLKMLCDGAIGVRFLLKDSFKARNSSFVINRMMMQVVAVGKNNAMRKQDIAVKTKVQTVTKVKEIRKKNKDKIEFKKEKGEAEL